MLIDAVRTRGTGKYPYRCGMPLVHTLGVCDLTLPARALVSPPHPASVAANPGSEWLTGAGKGTVDFAHVEYVFWGFDE